ncbi:MAG: hypothetical protein ACRD2D_12255, partial [Terriglobales bacterium]
MRVVLQVSWQCTSMGSELNRFSKRDKGNIMNSSARFSATLAGFCVAASLVLSGASAGAQQAAAQKSSLPPPVKFTAE